MQGSVSSLSKERLQKPKETDDDFLLANHIAGLWQILDDDIGSFSENRINHYIQWDDAWLLTALRVAYFKLKRANKATKARPLIMVQLEELLSNAKAYFSLFKRGDTFHEIDRAFLDGLSVNLDWSPITKGLSEAQRAEIDALKNYVRKYKEGNPDEFARFVEKRGFFTPSLLRLLDNTGLGGKDGMDFVKDAATDFRKNAHLKDVLIIVKKLKRGVDHDFRLVNRNGDILRLGEVSRIADGLANSVLFFPPFFLFLYREDDISSSELSKLRKRFGGLLAASFMLWISKCEKSRKSGIMFAERKFKNVRKIQH
jgi:hypothetical protein